MEAKPKRRARCYWKEINGNLYARTRVKDPNTGKIKDLYEAITDKRTARTVAERMRREYEMHGAEIRTGDKMRLVELISLYEQTELVPATYSASGEKIGGKRSIEPVKSSLKAVVAVLGNRLISSIKPRDLISYKNKRLATDTLHGKKPNVGTVNRDLAHFRVVLNYAVKNEWLIKNPFSQVRGIITPKAETQRQKTLTFDEETRLLSVCTGARAHIKPIIIIALDTAMRRGEILKMCWRDVDFVIGEIFIPKENSKTNEDRTVGLTARAKAELETVFNASLKRANDSVFDLGEFKTAFGTACKLSGINDLRFHDLRHSATTRIVNSGVSHVEAMKITGHTTLKTFLRYTHIGADTTRKVAESLESYLTSQKSNNEFSTDETKFSTGNADFSTSEMVN